jgi:glycosyltransferase involved in cell wall biosynthesis
MKIGFFTDYYLPNTASGGVAISIDIFRRELEKLGHEVYIFCPKEKTKTSNENRIIRFRAIRGFWLWGYRDTFPYNHHNVKKISKLNLDIVHIHTPAQVGLLGVYIAKKFDIPLVATYHTDLVDYGKVYKRVLLGLFLLSLAFPIIARDKSLIKDFLWTLRPTLPIAKWNQRNIKHMVTALNNRCDLVIAPSEKMKSKLLSYGTKAPIEVLQTGTDTKDLELTNKKISFKKIYTVSENDPLLLFVGRISKEKNIELIIRSLPAILERLPEVKLAIVGQGTNQRNLQKLAKRHSVLNSVIFTGYVSDEARISAYKECDIFTFASVTDTQGLVLNEAALFAKPMVFIDDQISPVGVDKVTGLKSKNNHGDFARKIISLLDNQSLRKKFGQNAQKIIKNYSGHSQAQKLSTTYNRLSGRLKK